MGESVEKVQESDQTGGFARLHCAGLGWENRTDKKKREKEMKEEEIMVVWVKA